MIIDIFGLSFAIVVFMPFSLRQTTDDHALSEKGRDGNRKRESSAPPFPNQKCSQSFVPGRRSGPTKTRDTVPAAAISPPVQRAGYDEANCEICERRRSASRR